MVRFMPTVLSQLYGRRSVSDYASCRMSRSKGLLPPLHHENMVPLLRLYLCPLWVPRRAGLERISCLFEFVNQTPSCLPAEGTA